MGMWFSLAVAILLVALLIGYLRRASKWKEESVGRGAEARQAEARLWSKNFHGGAGGGGSGA
jgi:hypothetical protein